MKIILCVFIAFIILNGCKKSANSPVSQQVLLDSILQSHKWAGNFSEWMILPASVGGEQFAYNTNAADTIFSITKNADNNLDVPVFSIPLKYNGFDAVAQTASYTHISGDTSASLIYYYAMDSFVLSETIYPGNFFENNVRIGLNSIR